MGRQLPQTVEEDYYEMPKRYSGRKATRYLDATNSVLGDGFDVKRHSLIKAFVKAERTDGFSKANPDPRMIQFRDPRYCVEISRFLKPIEEHLYRMKGISRGVPRTRNVAKGLNQVERACLLRSKIVPFVDVRILSLDASRFDKHVSRELLELEHLVYTTSNPHPLFARLLRAQLDNKCFSTRGIKYRTRGKRMSGDMNTALGNCVIMMMMLYTFMDWCGKWDCLDDGDDVLLLVEGYDLERVQSSVKAEFLKFGMTMKVEHVSDELHDVEFCQSKVIDCCGGIKFVRNPFKVLSCALSGVRYFGDPNGRRNLLYSIGTCELVLNLGVPVLQSFSIAIRRNARGKLNFNLLGEAEVRFRRELKTYNMTVVNVEPLVITDRARDTFALAFGIDVQTQLRMESWLENWSFNIEGGMELPEEWSDLWEYCTSGDPSVYPLYGF